MLFTENTEKLIRLFGIMPTQSNEGAKKLVLKRLEDVGCTTLLDTYTQHAYLTDRSRIIKKQIASISFNGSTSEILYNAKNLYNLKLEFDSYLDDLVTGVDSCTIENEILSRGKFERIVSILSKRRGLINTLMSSEPVRGNLSSNVSCDEKLFNELSYMEEKLYEVIEKDTVDERNIGDYLREWHRNFQQTEARLKDLSENREKEIRSQYRYIHNPFEYLRNPIKSFGKFIKWMAVAFLGLFLFLSVMNITFPTTARRNGPLKKMGFFDLIASAFVTTFDLTLIMGKMILGIAGFCIVVSIITIIFLSNKPENVRKKENMNRELRQLQKEIIPSLRKDLTSFRGKMKEYQQAQQLLAELEKFKISFVRGGG